jgi:F-type H+-transporting ATPase subunit epsilon
MTSEKVKLTILTAEGAIETGDYDSVTVPGCEGEFGVLHGHIAFLTPLGTGELRAVGKGEEAAVKKFAVHGGFCEVQDNKVLVMATAAEPQEKIDVERARRAAQRAKERLSDRSRRDIDFARAEAALRRATARLMVTTAEE